MNDKETLAYYQKLVRAIWNGDYGNGHERVGTLRNLGVDPYKVQQLVNLHTCLHPGLTIDDLKAVGLL